MRFSTRHLLLAVIASIAIGSPLYGQRVLAPLDTLRTTASPTLVDLERSFERFRATHDLRKTKGWKWFGRWEWFNRTRATPDGDAPDGATYWQAAMQATSQRAAFAKSAAVVPGWTPVGPLELPIDVTTSHLAGIGRINCVTFHPSDPETFWVGVAQGGVWKTVNGGRSWMPLTDGLPILRISDIAVDPNDTETLYIAVGDYAYIGVDLVHENRKRNTHYGMGIFKSIDGGATWAPTGLSFELKDFDGSLINRIIVDKKNSDMLVAAGSSGIWTSTDAGETWTRRYETLVWDMKRNPSNDSLLYATSGYLSSFNIGTPGVIRSTDFGVTWEELPVPLDKRQTQRIDLAISPSNPNYIYAIACDLADGFRGVYRTTDFGETWEARAESPNSLNILGWLNGGGGDDYGGQGTYDLVLLVHPTNPDLVYAGGVNLWGSSDGGATWDGISFWQDDFGPSIHADQHMLVHNQLDGNFYICNDGGIYRTREMVIGSWEDAFNVTGYSWPTEWTNVSDGLAITSFYRIGLSRNNAGAVIGGAQDNSVYYHDGDGWINTFGGDGMEAMIDPDDPLLIYGASQYGNLHRSADGGQSIEWGISDPIMSENDQGEWTTPYAMDPSNSSTIYGGYRNVWKSTDKGNTWQVISDFPSMPNAGFPAPASALVLAPSDPSRIYVAKRIYHAYGAPSEVWTTSNGGGEWRNITAGLPDSLYLTYIAVDRDDPRTAWVTCGGFVEGVKVFKTTNAGTTWTNVSRDLPNLPVNCVVRDDASADGVVYVGTDIGVYYTSDKTSGWKPYGENLPNVIVSELEIHYPTKKLYAATFGRGVWMVDVDRIDSVSSVAGEAAATSSLRASVSPSSGSKAFTLSISDPSGSRRVIASIVDITGRVVHREEVELNDGTASRRYELNLPYGLYFVRVTNGTTSAVVKIRQ